DKKAKTVDVDYCNIIEPFASLSSISHFLWINNTRTLFFVEENGNSHTYEVGTNYLRTFAQIPVNAQRILSSPDGACIFALYAKTGGVNSHRSDASVGSNAGDTTEQS